MKAPNPAQVAHAAMDKALAVSRPVILGHIRRLRRSRPDATPEQLLKALERHYLTTVAAGGGIAGATSAFPGIGTTAGIAINVAEIPVFFEATVMFALSYAEIHDVQVDDLERRRTLVYAVLLGQSGTATVRTAAGRVGQHWGRSIVRGIDMNAIRAINKVLGRNFVTKWGTKQGILVLGREIPLGIGAAIGAGGNTAFGYIGIRAARRAFGPPPLGFPVHLPSESATPKRPDVEPDAEAATADDSSDETPGASSDNTASR